MREDEFELVEGSGNVFRDLGDPDADLKQAKAIVAARIIAVLDERTLTVRKAEEITGFAVETLKSVPRSFLRIPPILTYSRCGRPCTALTAFVPPQSSDSSLAP